MVERGKEGREEGGGTGERKENGVRARGLELNLQTAPSSDGCRCLPTLTSTWLHSLTLTGRNKKNSGTGHTHTTCTPRDTQHRYFAHAQVSFYLSRTTPAPPLPPLLLCLRLHRLVSFLQGWWGRRRRGREREAVDTIITGATLLVAETWAG